MTKPSTSPTEQVPAYTAADLLGDPRLRVHEASLPRAQELADLGWIPDDVAALLDGFPGLTRKHATLLSAAVWLSHAVPDKGRMAGQILPPVVVSTWLPMLRKVIRQPNNGIALGDTRFAVEFGVRPSGRHIESYKMVSHWNRTTGDPYLAVIAAGTGMTRTEYAHAVAGHIPGVTPPPFDVEGLTVLAALRYGFAYPTIIIDRAKEALG